MNVITDEPVTGVADRVAAVAGLGDDAADGLLKSLIADGLSLPAERGLPDIARRVIDRLRGARPVEELGEVDAAFEILGLHVPPAGKAALHLARSQTGDRQVSITAIGSGFGGGRTLTLAVDEDIPERDRCMVVRQHVTLAVRLFQRVPAGEPWIRTDVVAWSNREFVGLPSCIHCGASGDDLDPLDFDEDEANALDLRSFDAAVTRKSAMTLVGKRKADIGVEVAGKAGAGFHLEQQTTISCTASYTFPAGRWFLPYRPAGDTAALPYWAVR